MRCRTAQQLMSLQIDGLLAGEQAVRLERHLQGCSRCRVAWSSLQQVHGLFSRRPWPEPPPDLPARVVARLPASRRAVVPAAAPVWTRATMVVVAAMVVLFLGLVGAVSFLGLGPLPEDWALVERGGSGVMVAAWATCRQVVEALWRVVGASWEALRWPYLPLLAGGVALSLGAAWLLWRQYGVAASARSR